MISREEQSKALAHQIRQNILAWLKHPALHFSHQASGDPTEIGVCVSLITEKLGVSQPTASRHLDLLRRAGFLTVTRRDNWAFYTRNETGLSDYKEWLNENL